MADVREPLIGMPESGSISVPKPMLAHMLLCSFRYSLGRATYITYYCRQWLESYWDILPRDWQQQIHRDIEQALNSGGAGMTCDQEEWRCVLRLPVKSQ